MKIKQIHIAGFGRLSEFSLKLGDGVNCIKEDNGWGKTTLAGFLKFMFYGLKEGRSEDNKELRERYKPWTGGVFGGSLDFEAGGRNYRISRLAIPGKTKVNYEFTLTDLDRNLSCTDYTEKAGEELFGLDRDSFEKTLFIGQAELETSVSDNIKGRIGCISPINDDMNNASKADEKLKSIYNANKTLANRLAAAAEKDSMLLREKESLSRQYAAAAAEKSRLKNEKAAITRRIEEINVKYGQSVLCKKYKSYTEICRLVCEKKDLLELCKNIFLGMDKLQAELDEKNIRLAMLSAAEKKQQQKKRKLFIVLLAAGFITALSGIIQMLPAAGSVSGIILAASGALLALIAAAIKFKPLRLSEEKVSLSEEISKLKAGISGLETKKAAYAEANSLPADADFQLFSEMYTAALAAKEEFENNNDIGKLRQAAESEPIGFDDFTSETAELSSEKDRISEEIQSCSNLLDSIAARSNEIDAELSDISEKKLQQAQALHRAETAELTRRMLADAKAAFTNRYNKALTDAFQKYYELFSGEKADSFSFDANMNLIISENSSRKNFRSYSDGTRDRISLSLRMALCDVLFQKEKPFIIFDDSFANFDETRLENGKNIIKMLASRGYQLIYFTCHESRKI